MSDLELEEENKPDPTECPENLLERLKMILNIALPTILTGFIQRSADAVNLSFLGHLDDNAIIAGAGMGSVVVNFLGWTIVIGLNSALDTLVSQAAGAGNLELCGVYLNRGRFVMSLLFVPVACMTFYTKDILIALGQQ
jgi:MATE family multidrug resistance protein